jgi:hypothetical protein
MSCIGKSTATLTDAVVQCDGGQQPMRPYRPPKTALPKVRADGDGETLNLAHKPPA